MTRAKEITQDIRENINTQKIIFKILISSSIVLFVGYVYLIGSITFNVIARKSLENSMANLTNDVNQLEITYLDNLNKIDKEYAFSRGFVETKPNIFVSRSINHVAIR